MTDVAISIRGEAGVGEYLSPGFSAAARAIAGLLQGATRHARANASDWRTLAITHVYRLREEYAEDGWDGYGAQPIRADTARHAEQFVSMLPAYLPAPDILPESDGEISFDWWFGPNAQFSISIGPSGTLTYAGLIGKGVRRYGSEPLGQNVSPHILSSIEDLIAKFAG